MYASFADLTGRVTQKGRRPLKTGIFRGSQKPFQNPEGFLTAPVSNMLKKESFFKQRRPEYFWLLNFGSKFAKIVL
jgi:hypothetical protein